MNLIATADTNGDGKIDRWEMYEYCLKTNPVVWWLVHIFNSLSILFSVKIKKLEISLKNLNLN